MGKKEFITCSKKCNAACAKKHILQTKPKPTVSGGSKKKAAAAAKKQSTSVTKGNRSSTNRRVGRPRTSANPRADRPKKYGWSKVTGRAIYKTKSGKLIEWVYPYGKAGGRKEKEVDANQVTTTKPDAKTLRRLRDRHASTVSRIPRARVPSTRKPRNTAAAAKRSTSHKKRSHKAKVTDLKSAPFFPGPLGKGTSVAKKYVIDAFERMVKESKGNTRSINPLTLQYEAFIRSGKKMQIKFIKEVIKEKYNLTI